MGRYIEHQVFTAQSDAACRAFMLRTQVFKQPVCAVVLIPEKGIHVSVYGGEASHIGAVSIIAPDGSRNDLQFPGHKDGQIAVRWADALHDAGFSPVTAEAGIHYDALSKEGISEVMSAADDLLTFLLQIVSRS